MTKLVLQENKTFTSYNEISSPYGNEHLVTQYMNYKDITKRSPTNRFENIDYSKQLFLRNNISILSDKQKLEKSENKRILVKNKKQ